MFEVGFLLQSCSSMGMANEALKKGVGCIGCAYINEDTRNVVVVDEGVALGHGGRTAEGVVSVERLTEHAAVGIVVAKVLAAEGIVARSGVGEKGLCSQEGFDGSDVIALLGTDTAEGVPRHGGMVVWAARDTIIVRGYANERVGRERDEAFVVGLRAKEGVEGSVFGWKIEN